VQYVNFIDHCKSLFCKENVSMLAYIMADTTLARIVGIGRMRVDFSILEIILVAYHTDTICTTSSCTFEKQMP
jgi:tRNA(Phe) wybutosine-synthesizing methylase Tyw3